MTRLAFLDTATTGIDPRTSWLWEFAAIIVDSVERSVTTLHWEYGPTVLGALPEALEVSRYHERHHAPPGRVWAANAETRALLAARRWTTARRRRWLRSLPALCPVQ